MKFVAAILAMAVVPALCTASHAATVDASLADLPLEDLMNVEVTSVAKKPQRLQDSAAAVYIITQEDIRRSGLTSIPELLRLVPGMQVAHMDSAYWAISARGGNDDFANKLLVLIDGRSVYTPLFSGVWWDVQDYLLEDIERIEVIRGPGATVWGANAVNGVVNIITKSAEKTTGTLGAFEGGGEMTSQGGLRYGGQMGATGQFRVYSKFTNRDNFLAVSGGPADDSSDLNLSGFRADWSPDERNSFSCHGDLYTGNKNQLTSMISDKPPYRVNAPTSASTSGGNAYARWEQKHSDRSEGALQFYCDVTRRESASYREVRTTYDLDYQNLSNIGGRHELTWGVGARFSKGDIVGSQIARFTPRGTDSLYSAFVQDEISFKSDRAHLTIGSKIEHNDYTGVEIQPNVRFIYNMDPHTAVWTSVSRAVRTPSQAEHDVQIFYEAYNVGIPLLAYVMGNPGFKSEVLTAYELGYRVRPTSDVSLDLAAFYNHYDNMRTLEVGKPVPEAGWPFPHMILPITIENLGRARSYGGELSATWIVRDDWKLVGGVSWINTDFYHLAGSNDTSQKGVFERKTPRSQFSIRSYRDIGRKMELDTMLYYTSSNFVAREDQLIPRCMRLDVRLAWRPQPGMEVSIGGRDIFGRPRKEYSEPLITEATEVSPSAYTKVTWSF